jgi:hypothetical protein
MRKANLQPIAAMASFAPQHFPGHMDRLPFFSSFFLLFLPTRQSVETSRTCERRKEEAAAEDDALGPAAPSWANSGALVSQEFCV